MRALRNGVIEQGHVVSKGAEAEALIVGARDRGGGGQSQRVGGEGPEENSNVLDVVAAALDGDAADVHGVRGLIEACVHVGARFPTSEIRRVVIKEADMIHVLGVGQHFEKLDGVGAPACDIARELLQDQNGSFSATERNGVGDFGAGASDSGGYSVDGLIADQITDVRNDPGSAGFDKLVIVELIHVFSDHC